MLRLKTMMSGGLCLSGAILLAGAVALPVLARSEAPARPVAGPPPGAPSFEAIDTNGDGKITPEEFAAFREARCPPDPGKHGEGKDGKGGGKRPGPERGPGMPGPEGLDTDKDGKLSWAEFSAPARARFDALDTNKNGFIEKDEMSKGFGPHGPGGPQKAPGKAGGKADGKAAAPGDLPPPPAPCAPPANAAEKR